MVVHGDDIIVAGCGEDLGWLSQTLNEKLELVQKLRLGPGYDSGGNCVEPLSDIQRLWSDVGSRPTSRRTGSGRAWIPGGARPQTNPGGAKPNAPLYHEELEPDGQKANQSVSARMAFQASRRPDIAFACKECSRAVGKTTRADLIRLRRIGRYLLHNVRAVWEFPLQDAESTVTIDGLSDAVAAGCLQTRRSTSGGSLRIGRHTLATWSSTQKLVSLSTTESEYYSMVRCAGEANRVANNV